MPSRPSRKKRPSPARPRRSPRVVSRAVRILIADAEAMDRRAMATLLGGHRGWKVVGEAASVAEAIELHGALNPDVLLLALGLRGPNDESPVRTVLEALPKARVLALSERGQARCLILNPPGQHASPGVCELRVDCLQLAAAQGAQGVLRRDAAPEELFRAIEAVAKGERWIEGPTRDAVQAGTGRPGFSAASHGLSGRELEVAELLSQGKSNKDIASQLGISEPTVKKHVGRVLLKLGCQDRLQAGLFVARHPLLLHRQNSA